MIHNTRQLKSAEKEIDGLQSQIAEIKKSESPADIFQLFAWKSRLKSLRSDVDEFNELLTKSTLEFSEKNLYKMITHLRIASGMTQRELAEAIEVQEQQIQRYEQNQYLNASLERVIQIVKVLSETLKIQVEVKKKKTPESQERFQYLYADNPHLEEATRTVKERKALLIA